MTFQSPGALLNAALEARTRIAEHLALPTPIEEIDAGILGKLETSQPTGSFKVRAALNGIIAAGERARHCGVIASSSGNFAQAVAWAAGRLGCSAQIVMTSSTSPYKVARTRELGAEVVLCEPTFESRWETTHRLQKQTGRILLHPYDSEETISANGTIGLELLEQFPPESPLAVLVPVSGGGLLAGISLVLKARHPRCRIFGVQQQVSGSLKRSLEAGKRVQVPAFHSIADALVAPTPGERTFEVIRRHVDGVLLVSEESIREAVRFLAHSHRITEAGGAVGLAAVRSGIFRRAPGETVLCVLSGKNIPAESPLLT